METTPARDRTRMLWLTASLHAFTHIYHVALIPLYLLVRQDFDLPSDGSVTVLLTLMGITYFLPAYFVGLVADHFDRKKLLGFGLLINGLGFVALSFAPTFGWAIAFLLIAEFGGSFFHPAATSMIANLFPKNTGWALGRVGVGASAGFFLAPLYSGWRAASDGWRAPILELGLLGVVMAGVFFWLAPRDRHENRKPHQPIKLTQKIPLAGVWVAFVASCCAFSMRDFAGGGMASLSSLFLQRVHGFDTVITGAALGCMYLASSISNPLFGGLSDRGRGKWLVVVLFFSAILILLFSRLPGHFALLALIGYGFFFMASYPMTEAALMESTPPAIRGRVFGLFITFGGMIGSLSHWLVGAWIKKIGNHVTEPLLYVPIFGYLSILILLSLTGLFFLRGMKRLKISERNELAETAVQTPP